jgi:hypothetical protein
LSRGAFKTSQLISLFHTLFCHNPQVYLALVVQEIFRFFCKSSISYGNCYGFNVCAKWLILVSKWRYRWPPYTIYVRTWRFFMEDKIKKPVLIAISVGCVVLAVVVFYFTNNPSNPGVPSEFAGQKIWVKCRDKDCEAVYEMDKKAFFEFMEEHNEGIAMEAPPLKCQKCGKDTVFRAEKCENCGEIFFYGNPNDFADRCPKCGFSKIEAGRKAAARQ